MLLTVAIHHLLGVVHVAFIELTLTLRLRLVVVLVATLKHQLDHFELLVLHGPHLLHLLLVDPLGLIKHARVTTG